MFENITTTDCAIIGLVITSLLSLIKGQFQFNNKMILDRDKKHDQELDKISAALIMIKDSQEYLMKLADRKLEILTKLTEFSIKINETQNLITELIKRDNTK